MSFLLQKNNHPCWGLTGGIGSGKSTVARLWQELQNVSLVDTDAISRQLTAPGGAAIALIRSHFGADFIDTKTGAMNRTKMREYVFSTSQARQELEAILHPLIYQQIQKEVDDSARNGYDAALLDIPLLVESGFWHKQLDAIAVVDCSVATQIQRVQQRNQLKLEAIQAILAVQASREERRAIANVVIDNDAHVTLEQLATSVSQAATYMARYHLNTACITGGGNHYR